MSSRKKRNDTLVSLIKNNDYDTLKSNLELVFARKMTTKVQKKEEEIIAKLKQNLKRK